MTVVISLEDVQLAGYRAWGTVLTRYRAGGVHSWKSTVLTGYKAGGVQSWRGTELEGYRAGGVQCWRVTKLAVYRAEGVQSWRGTELKGYRAGGVQCRRKIAVGCVASCSTASRAQVKSGHTRSQHPHDYTIYSMFTPRRELENFTVHSNHLGS